MEGKSHRPCAPAMVTTRKSTCGRAALCAAMVLSTSADRERTIGRGIQESEVEETVIDFLEI